MGWTLEKHPNNDVGYRSTMRLVPHPAVPPVRLWAQLLGGALCGPFPEVRGSEERLEPDGGACERVDSALLAVDDADRVRDPQAGLAERLHRRDRGPARGDDV